MISYFNVQRSCLRDGPGIRTTLFLKGCPLRCLWCHNPEGKPFGKTLMFRSGKCTSCGRCLGLCAARSVSDGRVKVDRALCSACGKCADACLNDASEICGREGDAEELFRELCRDRLFFEGSGGGITVSGGEPLSQAPSVLYLAKRAAEEGISFAVETSGYGNVEDVVSLAESGSLFLYDIKGIDDEKHVRNTGVSNSLILSNFEAALSAGADVIVRMPLIPGYNDSERDLSLMSDFLSDHRGSILHAQIMPYHRIGVGKIADVGGDASEASAIPDGRAFADRWLGLLGGSGVDIKVM